MSTFRFKDIFCCVCGRPIVKNQRAVCSEESDILHTKCIVNNTRYTPGKLVVYKRVQTSKLKKYLNNIIELMQKERGW